jgi:hypothetical protein
MNEAILNDLTTHVLQAIGPLPASRFRKQQMQEELLAHLLALYDEELASLQEEQAAASRAKQRFGRANDLCSELQAAVPMLERLVFLVYGKGNLMWRWIWIIGCVAVLVGLGFVLPGIAYLRNGEPNVHLSPSQAFWLHVSLPVLGLVLTLSGLGAIAYSVVRALRARSC